MGLVAQAQLARICAGESVEEVKVTGPTAASPNHTVVQGNPLSRAPPPPVGFNTTDSAAAKVEAARKNADDEIEMMRKRIHQGLADKEKVRMRSGNHGVGTGSAAPVVKVSRLDQARYLQLVDN